MFYIQFGPYSLFFVQFSHNFVPPEIDTKFNFYIKLIMIFLLQFTSLLNILVEGYYYFKIRTKILRMTIDIIYLKF